MKTWVCSFLLATSVSSAAMALDRLPADFFPSPPTSGSGSGGGKPTSLPEPGSMLLLAAGLAAAGVVRTRKGRSK